MLAARRMMAQFGLFFSVGPVLSSGGQVVNFTLHNDGINGWTMVAFRKNLSTLAVTRYAQSDDNGHDFVSPALDAGAGFTVFAVDASAQFDQMPLSAWDDPYNAVWTLKWFA